MRGASWLNFLSLLFQPPGLWGKFRLGGSPRFRKSRRNSVTVIGAILATFVKKMQVNLSVLSF